MKKYSLFIIFCIIYLCSNTDIFAVHNNFDKCVNEQLKKQNTNISKVKILNCSNNNINTFPDLKKYSSLEELDLSNNEISNIDSNLSSNDNLRNLNLSGNALYYLNNDISKLKKIEYLNLNSTHLIELPALDSLLELNTLLLENNQLLMLPSLKTNNLRNLKIDNNYLIENYILTANGYVKVENQKLLLLKQDELNMDNNFKLLKPKEKIARMIVSQDNIPLYGVRDYKLRDVKDYKGEKVNYDDFFDLNTGKIIKKGTLSGYVNLILNDEVYYTNLKVYLDGNSALESNENNKYIDRQIIVNNISKDKIVKITKKGLKNDNRSIFDANTVQQFDKKKALKFFSFDNPYIISLIFLILTIVPFLLIIQIMNKVKEITQDVSSI